MCSNACRLAFGHRRRAEIQIREGSARSRAAQDVHCRQGGRVASCGADGSRTGLSALSARGLRGLFAANRNPAAGLAIPDPKTGAAQAVGMMVARNMQADPSAARSRSGPDPGRAAAKAEDRGDYASLAEARDAAAACRRCPLWRNATQTVFGEGPESAEVLFLGEQPGSQEDLAGRPFVGPAGKLFNALLDEAGIARHRAYVTNAVKHFKFEPRGKRRIHSKPNAGEIRACRWWADHELALVRPKIAVALGATAIQSLLGKAMPVTGMRGRVIRRDDGLRVFITVHPSYILRIRGEADRQAERARFLEDMTAVKELL